MVFSATWFPGGPDISYIPLPIPDPSRTWGNKECQECSNFCAGHYLSPEAAIVADKELMVLPSTIIKSEVLKNNGQPLLSSRIEELAKTVLLATTEVAWWVEHICTTIKNRKEGAKKAAETRRRSKNQYR